MNIRQRVLAVAVGAVFGVHTSSVLAKDLQLKSTYKGSIAILTANVRRFAGAVSSFRWNGMEFIDRRDHGRLLQSAVIFDNLGGCYNPTEAGSSSDAAGNTSSSKVLSSTVTTTDLHTTVQAAFWMPPGTRAAASCGLRGDIHAAVNTTTRAGYEISKDVRFDYHGIPNSIEWLTTFKVPNSHSNADFEILTAYMPTVFSEFFEYSASDGSATRLTSREGTRIRPLIFSTADKNYAMGVMCPSSKQISYAYITFRDTVKWNCVSHVNSIISHDYQYRALVFFGNYNDVKDGMTMMVKENVTGPH